MGVGMWVWVFLVTYRLCLFLCVLARFMYVCGCEIAGAVTIDGHLTSRSIHVYIYICMCIYMHVCMCVYIQHMDVYMYAYVYMYIYVCMYLHIYMYTHTLI